MQKFLQDTLKAKTASEKDKTDQHGHNATIVTRYLTVLSVTDCFFMLYEFICTNQYSILFQYRGSATKAALIHACMFMHRELGLRKHIKQMEDLMSYSLNDVHNQFLFVLQ